MSFMDDPCELRNTFKHLLFLALAIELQCFSNYTSSIETKPEQTEEDLSEFVTIISKLFIKSSRKLPKLIFFSICN
jgi:hypothetical protein